MTFAVASPVRNGRSSLPLGVASVAGQGACDGEHIVIDGASTDGTVEWLRNVAPEGEIRRTEDRGQRSEVRSQKAESVGRDPSDFRPPTSDLVPDPSGLGSRNSALAPLSGFRFPPSSFRLRWLSEPDRGMYDALNKGFDLACGDILGWLNADEQYLPGTLAFVAEWFSAHPGHDLLFGDHLVVREDGRLLARRRVPPVRWPYVLVSHLYGLSCAMFFRRRVWDAGIRFDSSYRSAGDADWVVRVLRAGFRAGMTGRPLAAFTLGPDNLSRQAVSREEERRLLAGAPAWIRAGRGAINAARRAEMALRGSCRRTRSIEYELFTGDDPPDRTRFEARNADWRWPDPGCDAGGSRCRSTAATEPPSPRRFGGPRRGPP